MTDVELLPLPEWVNPGYRHRTMDYARANVEAATEALRAEVERLKQELQKAPLRRLQETSAQAERLAEALRGKAGIWEHEGIRLNGGATKPYTDDENSIRAFVLGCCADELRALLRDQEERK